MNLNWNRKLTIAHLVVLSTVLISNVKSQDSLGQEYPLRLQPELDAIDVKEYVKNDRLIRLQFNCIVNDGPCDSVGKWAKPRVKAALLGECLMCTAKQSGWLQEYFDAMIEKYPEMYRAAFTKYIINQGIQVSPEEKARLEAALKSTSLAELSSQVKSNTTALVRK